MTIVNDQSDILYLNPPSFPDKHKQSFAKDREELLTEVHAMRAKVDHIKRTGHYSAKGQAAEISAALATMSKTIATFKEKTLDRITAHINDETASALKPKTSDENPQVRFQRLHAKRELLAREDPTKLWTRLRQAIDNGGGEELIGALTLLEPEFPVAPRELVDQTRLAIAERTHPELGEYGTLKVAYQYLLGCAVNEMKTIAERERIAVPASADTEPYILSTGQPAPAGSAKE